MSGKPSGAGSIGFPELRQLLSRPDWKQFLSVFDGLTVGDELLHDFAGYIAFNFVHELHGLYDAEDLANFHAVAGFDEGRRSGRGRFVKSADDRGAHDVQGFFRRRRRSGLRAAGEAAAGAACAVARIGAAAAACTAK